VKLDAPPKTLKFVVLDDDVASKADFLGQAELPFAEIASSPQRRLLTLVPSPTQAGKGHCHLHVEVAWTAGVMDYVTITDEEACDYVTHLHCHLHWTDAESRKIAFDLRKKMAEKFPNTKVLQFLEKPEVATQPTMEILVPRQDLGELLVWMGHMRHPSMHVLFHPLSPNNYKDNFERTMWIGAPVPLNAAPLKNFDAALAAKHVPRDRIVGFLKAEKDAKPAWIPELVPAFVGAPTAPWAAPAETLPAPAEAHDPAAPEWFRYDEQKAYEVVTHYHLHPNYSDKDEKSKLLAKELETKLMKRFPGKITRTQDIHAFPKFAPDVHIVELVLKREDLGEIALYLAHIAPETTQMFFHPVSPQTTLDAHHRGIWVGPYKPSPREIDEAFDKMLIEKKVPRERVVGFLTAKYEDKKKFLPEAYEVEGLWSTGPDGTFNY
jgi:aromatic ring-cleaving dioxygenase